MKCSFALLGCMGAPCEASFLDLRPSQRQWAERGGRKGSLGGAVLMWRCSYLWIETSTVGFLAHFLERIKHLLVLSFPTSLFPSTPLPFHRCEFCSRHLSAGHDALRPPGLCVSLPPLFSLAGPEQNKLQASVFPSQNVIKSLRPKFESRHIWEWDLGNWLTGSQRLRVCFHL